MSDPARLERVVLDTSVLLGGQRRVLVAGAALRFYTVFWSTWIVSELVRKRTEWIADRAARDGADRTELRRRLRDGRIRVNRLVAELSRVFESVDYARVPTLGLEWLADSDDHAIMQTAVAAKADVFVLVSDNALDFPLGESRNGILLLSSASFLAAVYRTYANARRDVRAYLGEPL